MRSTRWAGGIAAVVVLGGMLVHGTAQAATGGASGAAVHRSAAPGQTVLSHWTPERMRAAKPAGGPAKSRSAGPQTHVLPAQSAPGAAGPAAGKPGAATSGLAAVSQSQVWSAHGQMPATTVGKLYYDKPDGP